jgi:hypothetical protein
VPLASGTEVDQFHPWLAVFGVVRNEEVLGSDVVMDDARGVNLGQDVGNLGAKSGHRPSVDGHCVHHLSQAAGDGNHGVVALWARPVGRCHGLAVGQRLRGWF